MDCSFRHRRVQRISTAGIAILHPGTFRVNQSLVLDIKHVGGSLFSSFWMSLHVPYDLHPNTEAFFPMEEHEIGTKIAAVRSGSHHTARDTHGVLDTVLREQIVGRAVLALCTTSNVRGASKYLAHHSGQSTDCLQLVHVSKLIEICIPNKAVLFHGSLYHLINRPRF